MNYEVTIILPWGSITQIMELDYHGPNDIEGYWTEYFSRLHTEAISVSVFEA